MHLKINFIFMVPKYEVSFTCTVQKHIGETLFNPLSLAVFSSSWREEGG
jgi:hypothetical protein